MFSDNRLAASMKRIMASYTFCSCLATVTCRDSQSQGPDLFVGAKSQLHKISYSNWTFVLFNRPLLKSLLLPPKSTLFLFYVTKTFLMTYSDLILECKDNWSNIGTVPWTWEFSIPLNHSNLPGGEVQSRFPWMKRWGGGTRSGWILWGLSKKSIPVFVCFFY